MIAPASVPPFPDVTVIVGDPRLPDVTKADGRYSPEDLEAVARLKAALGRLAGYRFSYLDDHPRLIAELTSTPPAFVFNLCDTGFGNVASRELHVPSLLEMLHVPYSGSPPASLACCYDKALVRAVASAHGIPVPAEAFVPGCDAHALPSVSFPALVKPNTGDGSVGITSDALVRDARAARAYLDRLRQELPGRDALVQEFLAGAEYAVALIGNPNGGFTVLPLLEVDYDGLAPELPRILSYESKTVPDSPYWRQVRYREARLEPAGIAPLVRAATVLFGRLGCRDYARFDFRCGADGVARLLEVNPNPAWCWDGKLQMMAGFAGWDEAGLFARILATAQQREASARQGPLDGAVACRADRLRRRALETFQPTGSDASQARAPRDAHGSGGKALCQ
jgi:D-alanine-D-alanine ligase